MSLLHKGFRPFFLLAALQAAITIPAWLLVWTGSLTPIGPLQGITWHAHEMIFGYAVAVLAGFLLTAVGNWTARDTAIGPALGALAALWTAGRLALAFVPGPLSSVIDLAFLPALTVALARPLIAVRSWSNMIFPVVLAVMAATNGVVHLDALGVLPGSAVTAHRLAVHLVTLIIVVMGGRIIPLFTRNGTGVKDIAGNPLLDRAAIGATALYAGAAASSSPLAWLPALIAGAAVLARMWRWGSRHTLAEPLLWVLHLGHAAAGLGLLLEAGAGWGLAPRSLALHTLTVGAIGTLTLGMMARVGLGHTGRPLRAGRPIAAAFALVLLAAVVRVGGPLGSAEIGVLWLAATCWTAAFVIYVVVYRPILMQPRVDGRPG